MATSNALCGPSAEEPLSEILSAVSMIGGVDIDLALSRIGRKQKVLETALKHTSNSIDEIIRNMEGMLSSGDLRGFSIEAHGLKSSLAGIGAKRHSLLASELEIASREGNQLLCEVRFGHFAELISELAIKLKLVFDENSDERKHQGDRVLLSAVVEQVIEFLNSYEVDDALGCLSRLDAFSYGQEVDALLGHIKNRINVYKYDEAIRLLGSLKI